MLGSFPKVPVVEWPQADTPTPYPYLTLSSHLQDGHLLPIAQDPEGKRVPGSKAWGYLTAPQGNGIHMGVQVCAVFVEIESVTLEAAPPFLPALVYQHV